MMLYPAMKDLLAQVPSRYQLVNVVAHRARQIAAEAEEGGYPLNEKPVSLAIQEKVTIDRLKLLDLFFLPHFNQPYNYITMAALNAE